MHTRTKAKKYNNKNITIKQPVCNGKASIYEDIICAYSQYGKGEMVTNKYMLKNINSFKHKLLLYKDFLHVTAVQ